MLDLLPLSIAQLPLPVAAVVTTCDDLDGGVDVVVVVSLTPRGTTHNWTDLSALPRAICKGESSKTRKV